MRSAASAVVQVIVDARGELAAVEPVAGRPELLEVVLGFLPELRYQPALLNGMPVADTISQTFRFPVAGGGGVRP
jgi:hypothetical protein